MLSRNVGTSVSYDHFVTSQKKNTVLIIIFPPPSKVQVCGMLRCVGLSIVEQSKELFCWTVGLFDPEGEGSTILRYVGKYFYCCTVHF